MASFERPGLGCIDADFCNQIPLVNTRLKSTRFTLRNKLSETPFLKVKTRPCFVARRLPTRKKPLFVVRKKMILILSSILIAIEKCQSNQCRGSPRDARCEDILNMRSSLHVAGRPATLIALYNCSIFRLQSKYWIISNSNVFVA